MSAASRQAATNKFNVPPRLVSAARFPSEFDHDADRAQYGGAGDGPPPHGRRVLALPRGLQLRVLSLLHAGDGTQGECGFAMFAFSTSISAFNFCINYV